MGQSCGWVFVPEVDGGFLGRARLNPPPSLGEIRAHAADRAATRIQYVPGQALQSRERARIATCLGTASPGPDWLPAVSPAEPENLQGSPPALRTLHRSDGGPIYSATLPFCDGISPFDVLSIPIADQKSIPASLRVH